MKTLIALFLTLATLTVSGQSTSELTERIKTYEASKPVTGTLDYMHGKIKPDDMPGGFCATYVRKGYMESKMFSSNPGIEFAKDYAEFFKKEGWTN